MLSGFPIAAFKKSVPLGEAMQHDIYCMKFKYGFEFHGVGSVRLLKGLGVVSFCCLRMNLSTSGRLSSWKMCLHKFIYILNYYRG